MATEGMSTSRLDEILNRSGIHADQESLYLDHESDQSPTISRHVQTPAGNHHYRKIILGELKSSDRSPNGVSSYDRFQTRSSKSDKSINGTYHDYDRSLKGIRNQPLNGISSRSTYLVGYSGKNFHSDMLSKSLPLKKSKKEISTGSASKQDPASQSTYIRRLKSDFRPSSASSYRPSLRYPKGEKDDDESRPNNYLTLSRLYDNSLGRVDLSGISKCASEQPSSKAFSSAIENRKLSHGDLSISSFSFSSTNDEDLFDIGQKDARQDVSPRERHQSINEQDNCITIASDLSHVSQHGPKHATGNDSFKEIERSLLHLRDVSTNTRPALAGNAAMDNFQMMSNHADIIMNRVMSSQSSNDIASHKENESRGNFLTGQDSDSDSAQDLTRVTGISADSKAINEHRDVDNGENSSHFSVGNDIFTGEFFNRIQSTPKHPYPCAAHDEVANTGSSNSSKDLSFLRMERSATIFYRKQITKKIFDSWYDSFRSRKIQLGDIVKRRNCRRIAMAWVKWTTASQRKKKERMRAVFLQWKEIHLQMKREVLYAVSSQRREMTQKYYEWKLQFDIERSDAIASIHYKLFLLTRCFQLWKVHIAERRVKEKMHKVARIHHEVNSTGTAFLRWKNSVGKSCYVKRQMNKCLLLRVVHGWRKWTQYSRMLHKRHLSACKEYHSRTIMKATLDKWRYKLKIKMAEKYHITVIQKRAFTLWRLRSRRLVLRQLMAITHNNMVLEGKCFLPWMQSSLERITRRKMFIKIITKISQTNSSLMELQSMKIMKKAFSRWKHSFDVIKFKEKIADERIRRIVRNAANRWKGKVVKKHLHQKLIAASPFFTFLRLKGLFMHWIREKQRADRDKQRAKVVAAILSKSCMSRIFGAWRIVTQEDRIIHHLAARIRRREVARVFDAWRLIVTRNLVSMKYRKLREFEKTQTIFRHWREKYLSILKERQLRQTFERIILMKAISTWKDFIVEVKQHRKDLSRRYLERWQKNVETRVERRERIRGLEASRHIRLKTRLRTWIRKADFIRRRRVENEGKASEFYTLRSKIMTMQRWRRQFHVHCIVSEYNEDKKFECLDNAFRQWKNFVQHQLQDAVGRFTDRLERESPRSVRNYTLSESYATVDIPFLRSSSGYFGSLPNVARIGSPLPVSPLASARSMVGRDSPASLSPDHSYNRSPKSPINSLQRSHTFSSPSERGRNASLERPRSGPERSRSPNSIPSSGSVSNKSPIIVPPLFTNSFRADDEVYTELVRPSSLPLETDNELNRSNSFLLHRLHSRDKSLDEDSPASVYGQNLDEDAISYYSFQSESMGINREHFMSGAIRHWRYLPLSKTFRAWFKYTQEKKIRKELFAHFVDCKNTWTIKMIFFSWHRKLYCRLSAERFLRTRTLRKYFNAIHTHLMQEKSKEEQNLVANLHLKNMCIQSAFQKWKRKFLTKRRLYSLVGRWQEAVHISENDKTKSDEFIKRRKHKMLRDAFNSWREENAKFEAAKAFSTTFLAKRILKSWEKASSKAKLLKKNYQTIITLRTSKFFSVWINSNHSAKKARKHYEEAQALKYRNIFMAWFQWTKEEKKLSEEVVKFQRQIHFKLVAQAFFIWSEEAERCRIADAHYRESVLIRVTEAWHEYTERSIDLVIRLEDYQRSSLRTRTRNAFDWWKRSAICSRVFKERLQIQNKELQKDAFSQWRKNVRQQKSSRHLSYMTLKKAFHNWIHKCVKINKQRRVVVTAAKKWRSKTRALLSLEERAAVFSQENDRDLMRKSFIDWRESANGLKVARVHFEYKLSSTVIQFWYMKIKRNNDLRKIKASVEEFVESHLVSAAFYTWVANHQRLHKNEIVLENYLELKQQEVLKLCLENFRINALKKRAEKHARYRIEKKAFSQWMRVVYQCKGLAGIRKRLLKISVMKYANKWRARTRELLALERMADEQRRKGNAKVLKKRFQSWVLKTRGRSLARMCFQGHLLKSTFIQWRRSTQRKVSLRTILSDHTQRKENSQLRKQLKRWKDATDQSQKSKKIAEVHEQIAGAHFRKSLLEKCFFAWRNECLIESMVKKRDLRTCNEYFAIWKNHCLGTNKAEQAHSHMLMEKAWKQWRKVKIKTEVMRAMEIHEHRKRLSEVFSAWYNFTYIRRRAVRDFKLYKKRSIFRRWMKEYNES